MKLWLLEENCDLPESDNPWCPWWDAAFAHVVRAETEEEARQIAHSNAGEEVFLGFDENRKIVKTEEPWKNPDYSTCVELTTEGESKCILTYRRDS